ncbi:hypothetical protein JTB14_017884 [Gonioctena quinquepunctata]|nr:hypothetical protein JTB14_017884 [Gonioctena quinquepunctata]
MGPQVTKGSIFHCKVCRRTYKYASSLYNHVRFECGKEPKFMCKFCSYRAKRKHCLKDHLRFIHGLEDCAPFLRSND